MTDVVMDGVPVELVDDVRPAWLPLVEVPVRMLVNVIRVPRARCVNCGVRRVLYRIAVAIGPNADHTEARCAPCWGIRERHAW